MILVTGGAGYIGSHTVLELLQAGYSVLVMDNLSNSSEESLNRIQKLTGQNVPFIKGDLCHEEDLAQVFKKYNIHSVMHFAGFKAVGESVGKPLTYHHNNVYGTLMLLAAMKRARVKQIVFSSSATVYGEPAQIPVTENCPLGEPLNPYGRSKAIIEGILTDMVTADPEWSVGILRYFNPIGAHESGQIGEDPHGIPNNLVPYISQVAVGNLPKLKIYGNDYPTRDGTGIRDYIHVTDLALGHIKALEYLREQPGRHIWNLGTGQGYSVMEVLTAFEKASGEEIPYEVEQRRPGDIAECWADCSKANEELQWQAQRDLQAMMRDTWRWQSKNPRGYN